MSNFHMRHICLSLYWLKYKGKRYLRNQDFLKNLFTFFLLSIYKFCNSLLFFENLYNASHTEKNWKNCWKGQWKLNYSAQQRIFKVSYCLQSDDLWFMKFFQIMFNNVQNDLYFLVKQCCMINYIVNILLLQRRILNRLAMTIDLLFLAALKLG